MAEIKALFFDLDNTLVDFMRMKRISCEEAVTAMIGAGLTMKKSAALKLLFSLYDIHGYEDRTIFQKFLKKAAGKVDIRVLAHGISAYRRVHTSFVEPYPHVVPSLLRIRDCGVRLAIVSDAPKIKGWIRLTSMNIDSFFDDVVMFDDTSKHKPAKQPFLKAMKALRLKPSECMMVGDSITRDIAGAKRLGMKTCYARYGATKPVRRGKSGADFEIDDIKELVEIIRKRG